MLCISRKPNEGIHVHTPSGDDITFYFNNIRYNRLEVAIDTNRRLKIVRWGARNDPVQEPPRIQHEME